MREAGIPLAVRSRGAFYPKRCEKLPECGTAVRLNTPQSETTIPQLLQSGPVRERAPAAAAENTDGKNY